MLRGYLYAEEHLHGRPNSTYVKRYFVSFPYCGVKWFNDEPRTLNDHSLLLKSGDNCGWLYGSNISLHDVIIEDATTTYKNKESSNRYPFKVVLKCGEHVTEIRLATSEIESRQEWVDEMFLSMKTLQYVTASFENDFLPYPIIFESMKSNAIHTSDILLNTRALCTIAQYLNLSDNHRFLELKLNNVGLTDSQILLVNQIINQSPMLGTISLAKNKLSGIGILTLCESLKKCTNLTILDLSFNFIDDSCCELLTNVIDPTKILLQHLNVSNNLLTEKCISLFTGRVASHRCKLRSVDFSGNFVGDSIANVISLLLYNKPSHLEEFNVSNCGISDAGIKELTLALPSCSTLMRVNVKCSFVEPVTLQAFVAGVGTHHSKYPAKEGSTGLVIAIGGIEQSCDDCKSLRLKSLKVALPYMSETSGVYKVTLRRHLAYTSTVNSVTFDKFSGSGKVQKFQNMLTILDEGDEDGTFVKTNTEFAIVEFEVCLPVYMTCVEELLECLAICLKIDASQLKMLSSIHLNVEMRLYSICVNISSCSYDRAYARNARNRDGYVCCKDIQLLHYDPILSVDSILSTLERLANNSSPVLTKLGVKKVLLKCPNEGSESVQILVNLAQTTPGGRGLEDYSITPFSAKDVSQYEGNGASNDTDDDETFDKTVRDQELPIVDESDDEDNEEFDEIKQARVLQAAHEAALAAEEAERIARENLLAAQTKRRNLRANNERLVLATRKLYEDGFISSMSAKFWEGAFGHVRHKEVTKKAMVSAIEPVSGIFHSVHKRELMCNAMFQRDLDSIHSLLAEYKLKPNGTIEGGSMFIYGQRLYSEIIGLQKRFIDVQHVAQSYDKLSVVEDFLLSCGVLGYSGPEMFQAVELRQQLVATAVNEGDPNVLNDLPLIKYKALLSNLLISRDMLAIETKMEELKYSTDDHLIFVSETIAAQTLLEQCLTCMLNLEAAIKSKDIETIDNALAECAYHYFYSNTIDDAIALLNAISKNPSKLLLPIITGLRDNDMLMINNGFEMLNKMGWNHPALDSVIVSRIFALKSKLVQDDGVKSKLIKLCLAINNGFAVKAGEMMQLLRRAHAIGLEYDSDMKPYLTILNKHMKKYQGLVKQEKIIQKMIDDDDVPNLAKVLAGRGTGKLVMSAPSAYAQEEWLIHLEEVCSGSFLSRVTDRDGKYNEKELCFTGTLEKAARKEGGGVAGWRRRFFVLETITLTYFTKATNGDKKGSIRVLGGGVRKMEPHEVGGRLFCIELEEGRDISQINPDLLEEARKHVRLAKINEIQSSLQVGVKTKNLELLTKTIQFAADLEIMLSFELMNAAKQCIQVLKEKNLKKDLHAAARLIPEGRLFELISIAETLKMDPHIASYAKVIEVSGKSDIDQCLLRARGALEINDVSLFRKVFKTLTKFDLSLLSSRQRYFLGAIVMHHCGSLVLTMMTDGSPVVLVYKLIRHALSCCRQLMVEPECMDAGRLLIALSSRLPGQLSQPPTSEKITSLVMYLEHLKIHSHSNPQLDARKFGRLRLNSSHAQKGIVSALLSGGRSKTTAAHDLISFNNTGLAKSLLKYEPGVLDQPLCIEAFLILNVIMGDRPMNSLSRPKKVSILRKKATNVNEIILDLIDAGAVRFPLMRDELYFQLVKQLSNNPSRSSRAKGWLLFTVYLHAFRPSQEAFPYIKDFIADAFEVLLKQRSSLANSKDNVIELETEVESSTPAVDSVEVNYFINLVSYCSKLVSGLVESAQSVDARAVAAASSAQNISQITVEVIAQIFEQRPLSVELTVMTGSVYQCSVPFGQLNTPFSLMCYLYDRMVPNVEQTSQFDTFVVDNSVDQTILSEKYYCAHVRAYQVMTLFRGFGLYSVEESQFNEELSDIDIAKVPVQPEVGQLVDFTTDLQWDLLLSSCNDLEDESKQVRDSKFSFGKSLVIRRKHAMASEKFSDSYQLFKDEVSKRDISGLQALWSSWLLSEGLLTRLPVDHVRIDLIFAEDTRYVNSRLYPLSDDSFHYLLALQLALCWMDEKADHWGEGDDGVTDNVTVSVRPSYKFFPREAPQHHGDGESESGRESQSFSISEVISHNTHDSDSDEETRQLQRKMERKLANEASESENDEEDEADEQSDAESSEYQSSVDVDEPIQKEKRFILPIVCNYEDLHDDDREFLLSLIEKMGVAIDSIQIDQIVSKIKVFHALATNSGVLVSSEKYRYMLKRAYVEYLMIVCPFYGNFFTEVTLMSTSNDESQGQHMEDNVLGALDESKVIIGVSANGLTLFDAEDWSLLFKAPIWDIQESYTSVVTKTTKTKVKGKKEPVVNEKKFNTLTMVVNSLTLTFKGDKLEDIVSMLHEWTREVLGRAYFPYGSEYPEEVGANNVTIVTNDTKLALQRFLSSYPLIPKPPIPEDVSYSERYFEAPKSRREILALERAEEERVELEMIRLANESQMERNQKQIKQGREEMKKYQTETEADGNEDDDDENENAEDKSTKKRSKRFNRSVFQKSVTSVDLREQINYGRLCTAVSGVPERTVSQLNSVVIPSVPMMVNGIMKFDNAERKRLNYKPIIEDSKGLDAVDLPQHVGISWNLAASIAIQPVKVTKKNKDGKSNSEKLMETLMQTRQKRISSYLNDLADVETLREEQTSAIEHHTLRSNAVNEDDENGAFSPKEKDVYLYGLNAYIKKKSNAGTNKAKSTPRKQLAPPSVSVRSNSE